MCGPQVRFCERPEESNPSGLLDPQDHEHPTNLSPVAIRRRSRRIATGDNVFCLLYLGLHQPRCRSLAHPRLHAATAPRCVCSSGHYERGPTTAQFVSSSASAEIGQRFGSEVGLLVRRSSPCAFVYGTCGRRSPTCSKPGRRCCCRRNASLRLHTCPVVAVS